MFAVTLEVAPKVLAGRRRCLFAARRADLTPSRKDLVVEGCLCGTAERDADVHEFWELSCPLKGLTCSH